MATETAPSPDRAVALTRSLADAVRARREQAGYSQGELARLARISAGTLSMLESGTGNPTVATVLAVAEVFGCTVADLTAGLDDPLVTHVPAGAGIPFENSMPETQLLHRFAPTGPVEVFHIVLAAGWDETRPPHPHGTYEHVYLAEGELVAGPEAEPTQLHAGDYLCLQGWAPHVYRAGPEGARLLLLLSTARSPWAQGLLSHGLRA
jgi:transcriptional regulator with XRE-family HTH domain